MINLRRIHLIFSWLRTQLIYRWFFKKIGLSSVIFGPLIAPNNLHNVLIGNNVRILPGARIELNPSFKNSNLPIVEIGDNANIGQNFFLSASENIFIGKNILFSDNVALITDTHIHNKNSDPINSGYEGKEIILRDFTTIYRNSTVMGGSTMNEHSVLGANSILKESIKRNAFFAGNPASLIKVNE